MNAATVARARRSDGNVGLWDTIVVVVDDRGVESVAAFEPRANLNPMFACTERAHAGEEDKDPEADKTDL